MADTTYNNTDKPKEAAKTAAVVSPPHFGDLGKAANDTFSKVIQSPPISGHQLPSPIALNAFLCRWHCMLTCVLNRIFLSRVCSPVPRRNYASWPSSFFSNIVVVVCRHQT